ncbi:MAG: hypothetical protein LBB15_01035 [Puniceicoccales bacterium]|nr:hypothetical protein [Puniceicoccales bacterium]
MDSNTEPPMFYSTVAKLDVVIATFLNVPSESEPFAIKKVMPINEKHRCQNFWC